jgi:hypothetical protein
MLPIIKSLSFEKISQALFHFSMQYEKTDLLRFFRRVYGNSQLKSTTYGQFRKLNAFAGMAVVRNIAH